VTVTPAGGAEGLKVAVLAPAMVMSAASWPAVAGAGAALLMETRTACAPAALPVMMRRSPGASSAGPPAARMMVPVPARVAAARVR
jgi:hypothetical protein